MRLGLCCGGISFRTAPLEIRERVSFATRQLPLALPEMRAFMHVEEAVLVSTCNRVDFFARSCDPGRTQKAWAEFLQNFHRISTDLSPFLQFREERSCVEYLFRVAAGLESMVVGETEILGQLKEAYGIAKELGMTGPWLNRLFQSAFAAAKQCRSSTFITRGSVSVGSVAADLAEKLFGSLTQRVVVLIGTGTMATRTARALHARGAKLVVIGGRHFERAQKIAFELGAIASTWEEFAFWGQLADVILSSTSAPNYVIRRENLGPILSVRRGRPLFLIDLAVPRDIDPSLHLLDDVYLYNIDDLKEMAEQNLKQRYQELERCSLIIQNFVDQFMKWAQDRFAAGELAPRKV